MQKKKDPREAGRKSAPEQSSVPTSSTQEYLALTVTHYLLGIDALAQALTGHRMAA